MAKTSKRNRNDVAELLRDLLIVNLAVAGVKHQDIRKIVGCDINRVTSIARHLRRRGEGDKEDR